jgi:hypothetical protein
MDWKVWLIIVLALVGVYFVGKGITGFVISESCCFGPDCEYLCDVAEPHVESPARINGLSMLGGSILLLALLVIAMNKFSSKHRRKV